MKKLFSVLLIVFAVFGLCACSNKQADEDAVTMLVRLGSGEAYYTQLAEDLENELGITVKFVYENSTDPTDQIKLDFKNNNLQADIIFSNSKVDDEYLKDSCVDLLSETNITEAFTYNKVSGCTTDDGAVYQLPFSSKLIGITYNATLMEEMGWEVPKTFDDMLDLKAKCDEAGIPFSVSDFRETGHGFNYLFHIMGSEWLSTLEGTTWLENYLAGNATIDEFKSHCEYFAKWVDNDLFGEVNLEAGWGATTQFAKTRALFCFAILNNSDGYQGPMYDADGNETGVTLNDVHKTMPWISEDGSNNCFTYYDNGWVMVNKALLADDQAEKFEKVKQILEYMTGEKCSELTKSLSKDVYLALKNFEFSDDRLYSEYADDINNGYIQPWYYNEFDANTIVNTGAEVDSYCISNMYSADEVQTLSKDCNYTFDFDVTFDKIFEVLDENHQNLLNATVDSSLK